MKKLTVTLSFSRSTSNWHVYQDRKADVTPVYISKEVVDGEPPKAIIVTVEEAAVEETKNGKEKK